MANFPGFYPQYPHPENQLANIPPYPRQAEQPGGCEQQKQLCQPGHPPFPQVMSFAPTPPGIPPIPGIVKKAVPLWTTNFIISNRRNVAYRRDPDLVNPWGIVIDNGQLWVVNDATDSITNYDLFGNKILSTISIRDIIHNSSYPTGIAINCGGGFPVIGFGSTRSARLIVPTQHGTIHAFNPDVDSQVARVAVNPTLGGEPSVYKGIAISHGRLYLADFYQGKIIVFNSTFDRLNEFPFVDGDQTVPIPADYSPFNVVAIGDFIYVLWARKDPIIPIRALEGPGHGIISKFNLDGSFVSRFHTGGPLNMPWAMCPAPADCGIPPGSFLVGNHGDGRIHIFDHHGVHYGPMLNQGGTPLVIDGLWGLAPYYTPGLNQIYFSASGDPDAEGIVGIITKHQILYY